HERVGTPAKGAHRRAQRRAAGPVQPEPGLQRPVRHPRHARRRHGPLRPGELRLLAHRRPGAHLAGPEGVLRARPDAQCLARASPRRIAQAPQGARSLVGGALDGCARLPGAAGCPVGRRRVERSDARRDPRRAGAVTVRRWWIPTIAAVLTLSACNLPGGAPQGPSYRVTAEFSDVLDLVPQAAVKVNDVTVGSVQKITLSGWNARVEMAIDRDVRLPANATAAIAQTSLLGEEYVGRPAPAAAASQGTLADGAVIPLSRTSRSAEVEEVLGALGLLLNGGGLAQLKTISQELTKALSGRESTVTDLLRQL